MVIDLQKLTPRDLAVVGRYIHDIGGRYIVYSGDLARYQSYNRGLNIEFKINSLVDSKEFTCSLPVDRNINKQIGELSKGEGQVTFAHENGQYWFSNQSRTVALRCVDSNLQLPAIDDQIYGCNKIEGPNSISTKGELSLTGREDSVRLIVRDETFTGINVDGSGEHYFDPDSLEDFEDHQQLILRSNYFLKIGREKFTLKLLKKENQFWLLTEVKTGLGIQCRMLETLTTSI